VQNFEAGQSVVDKTIGMAMVVTDRGGQRSSIPQPWQLKFRHCLEEAAHLGALPICQPHQKHKHCSVFLGETVTNEQFTL
jgi:hypothetical protein